MLLALAQADVSIALGSGSHSATATADFALISDNLLSLITLQAIARATHRRIIGNFGWACVYNIVLIPLAAGAFYDFGRIKLPAVCKHSAHYDRFLSVALIGIEMPQYAVASLAMALSSLSVVFSSLLLRYTFKVPRDVEHFQDQRWQDIP